MDVHNLFAQLLGAGLVKGDDGEKAKDGKAAVIPGLEVKNSEPSAKEKKKDKDKAKAGEEDKGGAEEGESEEEKKRKEEEERKRKEEEQRKAKELEIQPITLQSHDPSLKQRQVRYREICLPCSRLHILSALRACVTIYLSPMLLLTSST